MYESPITITEQICNELAKQKEEHIYQAILKVDVNVDKDELIKALAYDRNQYNKGFEDGIKAFTKKIKEVFNVDVMMPSYYVRTVIENALKETESEQSGKEK